jgi:hypothetical protein
VGKNTEIIEVAKLAPGGEISPEKSMGSPARWGSLKTLQAITTLGEAGTGISAQFEKIAEIRPVLDIIEMAE